METGQPDIKQLESNFPKHYTLEEFFAEQKEKEEKLGNHYQQFVNGF